MKSNTVRLGDIADICSGGTPSKKRDEYWKGSIPWVSAKSMDADWLNTNFLFISEEGLKAGSKLAPSNSILLLTRGSGLFNRIPVIWIAEPLAFNQDIKCITAKSPLDTRFIYHWLCSQREHLSKMLDVTGLGAGKINTDQLLSLEVFWPEYSVRRKIVTVADSIVEKMKLNQLLNDYLAEMLLAKYDQLFGPFSEEKCNGTLADLGEVVGGATPSKKKEEYYCRHGIGWITPRDLSNTTDLFIAHGADDISQAGYDSCSAKLMPKGSVLFSSRAPIGYLAIAADEVTTNQGFKSVVPKPEIGTAFVYCFLQRNKQRIADMGAGTTFPEVSGKTMKGVELELPGLEKCAELTAFAEPILAMIQSNECESRELSSLRDALLPKLMSGEIDVSKVDLTQLNNHLA